MLEKIYNYQRSDSLATNLRRKRFSHFKSLVEATPGLIKILDVGGTQDFWKQTGTLSELKKIEEITVLNIKPISVSIPRIRGIVGDARSMRQFADGEFDIVFSNSVIEHMGNFDGQVQMANEIKRVGKRYFVQTPNLYFPIEPHFVFPFFQFLPLQLKVWLIMNFSLGWYDKVIDREEAVECAKEIKLLSRKDLIHLFPDAEISEERVFGLTKSFIAYSGWST